MEQLKKVWRSHAAQAFFLSAGLACIVFIPFMIGDRGYMLYFGDFNVQQVPFYKLAHEAVRSGNILWNWHTDLGVNFIGSYSFYLLFSPFFWLTLPFPTEFVPKLIGPLLILKTACAGLTSYLYIKRFVKDRRYAVLGSVLYAFSGFMSFNIFFNHFHEVAVFFPLLLVGLEELVVNDRRGLFALAVAVNCLVNYWFFIGEVVFVVLYFFVRLSCGDWPVTWRKFFRTAFESVVGLMLAMFLLLPSVLAIMDNPRVGGDQWISGWLMWIYGYSQRLPAIWASFFFPPELPSQPNLFPNQGANWSSMSAYLPLFSMSGVIAYLCAKKRDFIKRMLITCAFMASVPVLNSLFVLFNVSYYARWFYMPILLMCVATVVMLEQFDYKTFMRGVRWSLFITVGIGLAIGFTPTENEDGERILGLMAYPERFWGYFILCLVSFVALIALVTFLRRKTYFLRLTTAIAGLTGAGIAIALIAMGKWASYDSAWVIDTALEGRYRLELPDDGFARSDIYDSMDNLGMFWGLPNIQAFHSIVPGSLMEFYPSVGIKRDVSSKPSTDYVELRSLLSVRWLFVKETEAEVPMPGFSYYGTQLGYNIYENDNFLPMGFGYRDSYGPEMLDYLSYTNNVKYMLSALYLDEDAVARNSDIITHRDDYESFDYFEFRAIQLWELVQDRLDYTCDTFEIDNRGFTATSHLDEDVLMFFSVPYDRGWRATVNGEPARVEKANIGFMAVRVPAGAAEIRFDYTTPGLYPGLAVSALGLLILAAYLILMRRLDQKRVDVVAVLGGAATPDGEAEGQLSFDELPPPCEPQPVDGPPPTQEEVRDDTQG